MINVPNYTQHAAPESLQPFIRRILVLEETSETLIQIPARPTGRTYLGWLAQGWARAQAGGQEFSVSGGLCHLAGQLTVFDACYKLNAPARHFLAEFTATGAYRLFGRDLDTLVNTQDILDLELGGTGELADFEALLSRLAEGALEEIPAIKQAAQILEDTQGQMRIDALAAQLNISERQLRRDFTRIVGIAPKPFAMIQRVLYALAQKMAQPDVNASDLALEAGFSDQPHLIRTFQLYLRASPQQLELDKDGVLRSIVAKA